MDIMGWITEILQGPSYAIGNAVWNGVMAMIGGLMTTTPQAFSATAWESVTLLYNWALGIGLLLLNLFFLIGFFKQASNLRENITWEILIEHLIKAIVANSVMISGLSIIQEFFDVSALLCGDLAASGLSGFTTEDLDLGSWLFFFIFGAMYVMVAIACSFLILFAVYGRYLKLYIMTIMAPLALSTWAGGRAFENSAYAWIKAFLVSVFEILVIALVMKVGGAMISSIDFGTFPEGIMSVGDGFLSVLQSLFTMILMAGAVKGAETQLKKAFGV